MAASIVASLMPRKLTKAPGTANRHGGARQPGKGVLPAAPKGARRRNQAPAFEKAVQTEGLDWGERYRPLGRQALAEILEGAEDVGSLNGAAATCRYRPTSRATPGALQRSTARFRPPGFASNRQPGRHGPERSGPCLPPPPADKLS